MDIRKEIEDFMDRMNMCLKDHFLKFAPSDIDNWIQELIELRSELYSQSHSKEKNNG